MRKIREREGKSWGKFYRARGARSEGFANEGTEIFIVADGGVEEKLIFIESSPAVAFLSGQRIFDDSIIV